MHEPVCLVEKKALLTNADDGSSSEPLTLETVCTALLRRCIQESEMRKRELAKLIGMLGGLTHDQRKVVVAELSAAENRVAAVDIVEGRLPARPHCPHCGDACTVRNGHANGLQRHKCRSCGKTFNALTGTPLARLHLRGKWLAQAAALRDGLSLNRTADRLGIAQSTAFRWRHRFLAPLKPFRLKPLSALPKPTKRIS
jgi:transposase-like protein